LAHDQETIANISAMRRSDANARYRRKIQRCERLLIAAHYLISHSKVVDSGDEKLLADIRDELGRPA
jgi:hypothetical protein